MNERTHKFKRQYSDLNLSIYKIISNKLDNNKKQLIDIISNSINKVYIKRIDK